METYIWVSFILGGFNVLIYAAVLAIGRVPYTLTITPSGAVLRLVLCGAAAIWAAKLLGVL